MQIGDLKPIFEKHNAERLFFESKEIQTQLSTTDLIALASMKNAALFGIPKSMLVGVSFILVDAFLFLQ